MPTKDQAGVGSGIPGRPVERLGEVIEKSLAALFDFPNEDSDERRAFDESMREIEEAERRGERAAQGVRFYTRRPFG